MKFSVSLEQTQHNKNLPAFTMQFMLDKSCARTLIRAFYRNSLYEANHFHSGFVTAQLQLIFFYSGRGFSLLHGVVNNKEDSRCMVYSQDHVHKMAVVHQQGQTR